MIFFFLLGRQLILVEGSMNGLSGLSLLTLVFCIFTTWPMGVYAFCLKCSSIFEDKFSSLLLTVFGGRIADLSKRCFIRGDFPLLGGVFRVEVVGSLCVFGWAASIDFSLFVTTCCVCVCWNSSDCSFFWCSSNYSQSFGSNWISFSTRAVYLLSSLVGFTLRSIEA